MRHVDDAQLVAYADDALGPEERVDVEAHLATCAECRARIDEERALAGRAAALLGASVPEAEPAMPSFAEILRRSEEANATSPGGAPARRWSVPPLAWAAMLVVGFGAAVIARTLLVSPEFNAPAGVRSEMAEDAAAPRTLAVPSDATDAAAETQRFDAEAANARAEAPGTHGAIGTVPPPPMPAPAAAPQAEARTLSAVAETTVAKAAEPRASEPADLRRRAQDAPQVEPSRPRERYPDMVRDPDARPADAARAAAAPPPVPAAAAVSPATAPGSVALGSTDIAWRGESAAEASARGTVVWGIPGAPVSSVWLAVEDADWRARVVQDAGDVSVEIIEWRRSPGVTGERGTVGDGRNFVVVERDGVMFLLRAALPIERLEALGAELVPLR